MTVLTTLIHCDCGYWVTPLIGVPCSACKDLKPLGYWYCPSCDRIGKPVVVESRSQPDAPCPQGHLGWRECGT